MSQIGTAPVAVIASSPATLCAVAAGLQNQATLVKMLQANILYPGLAVGPLIAQPPLHHLGKSQAIGAVKLVETYSLRATLFADVVVLQNQLTPVLLLQEKVGLHGMGIGPALLVATTSLPGTHVAVAVGL